MSKKGKAVVEPEPEPEVVEEIPKDLRTVTITIESYRNIIGVYPTSDIKSHCKYLEEDLGETSPIPVTDDENLPANDSFSFQVDFNSTKEIDLLISSPALLTVWQCAGTCDPDVYDQLVTSEGVGAVSSVKSFDSVVSIYEALTGETVDLQISETNIAKPAKGKKGDKKAKPPPKVKGKDKASSKVSLKKDQKSGDTGKKITVEVPVVYGMCAIDFLPFFYGHTSFSETLVINPLEKFDDERMTTYKTLPKVAILVSIDKLLEYDKQVIMNITVESIYNLPSLMSPDMDFKVCATLPIENSPKEPILFVNPQFTSKIEEDVMKCWPGMQKVGVNANTTKYKINPDDDIKNTVGVEIDKYLKDVENDRLQFNYIKRTLLLRDGMDYLSYQIQIYRKIVLEIYMTTKQEQKTDASGNKKGKDTSPKKGKPPTPEPFLHLMAILDCSSLLYPGVTKVRLASPLSTFTFEDALKAGQDDSYFRPKPKAENLEESAKGEGKKKGGKDKGGKDSKSKESKSSKGSKAKAQKKPDDTGDLKPLLPPEPEPVPEPEPSIPAFTEDGKPCFIVVEIELSKPINEKRHIEDLHDELKDLLKKKPRTISKIVLTNCLSKNYYREVISEITREIYEKYHKFRNEHKSAQDKDFVKYLQRTGSYQTYLTSITKAASLVVTNTFQYLGPDKQSKLHENLIGKIFIYLVREMNDTLNQLISTELEPVTTPEVISSDKAFFYAKEALQLGRKPLAERYLIERICNDEDNPDYWFDFAIYYLETEDADIAFECIREALAKKPSHKYSLVVFGTLLANKGQMDEAETCLLNLLVDEPRWIEGWAVLYLFYEKYNKHEGMDMAREMIHKYARDERTKSDYFTEFEDLAWTYKICPKTVFFRTAVLLLKMRLYSWVEMALAQEIQKHYGLTHYLLAAVCFYKKMYDHALEHIDETKAQYGSDYAVSALSGHCLLAMNRQKEAKEEYFHLLESYNRPEDVHMVYINCARVLEYLDKNQEARKLILLACKYSPTPYTWFKAGHLYFEENDLLSAEECLSESNYEDNRCPEVWGFLALVNLKLNRMSEAELCYRQAIKGKLKCEGLLKMIERDMMKAKGTLFQS